MIVLVLVFTSVPVALAIEVHGPDAPNSSYYLSSYAVDLVALGNGEMSVGMDVMGTGVMSKIGVSVLLIEQKINGAWQTYDVIYGITQSDFFAYNTFTYTGEYIFTGTAGVQYRATITAYAKNSSGYDTGNVTSLAVTCHNP
jgi:hypothetical protein